MPTSTTLPPIPRYKTISKQKAEGATYTPPALARFVAAQIVTNAKLPDTELHTQELHILDPAMGDGELLLSLLAELAEHSSAPVVVHGFDTNAAAVARARQRLTAAFPKATLRLEVSDFLKSDFLKFAAENAPGQDARGTLSLFSSPAVFSSPGVPVLFDLIIANPPYVRTQIMGAEQAQQLATTFGLNGRVDLYQAFLLAIARVLKPSGTAGIIVSNRFMTTRGGATLRTALRSQLGLLHIWDLGDTKLFEAAVLPAVILAQGRNGHPLPPTVFTSIYETDELATLQAADPIAALPLTGNVALENDGRCFRVQHGTLDNSGSEDDVWRIATPKSDLWLSTVQEHTWKTFGEIGKIRVGVKTCADKIFIRSDWHELPAAQCPELLRPLTTHHNARRFRATTPQKPRQILYPHESVGGQRQVVDITQTPHSRAYLESHRTTLEARTYVIAGGRRWYELWVPQDPAVWEAPKLVFRDIAERPTFWLDLSGTIINGDCYWMTSEKAHSAEKAQSKQDGHSQSPENSPENSTELLWLAAAVANSKFIEAFYDHRFNNKLYAGRRRFMTQYVEQFPLPDPQTDLARRIVQLAREIYDALDKPDDRNQRPTAEREAQLDALIWQAFGLPDPSRDDVSVSSGESGSNGESGSRVEEIAR